MPAISPALIARLRAAADPAADRDLLRAFLADRSEPAFATLVSRHGPMVLGVCRRVLGNPHDADDAFQATFLVLARKANAVGRPDRLPGWLHTIAVRTATEVRRMRDRRRRLETASRERQRPEGPPVADAPGSSEEQSELAALLDEELANLPEHYRTPVVLCELQGLSRKEAAQRLSLPEGTLSSRLAKARKLLADRLTRRGVTASTAAIAATLSAEAAAPVPAVLALGAARAALTSAATAAAAHAADGVVKALFVTKLKGLTLAVGVAVACAGGAVLTPGGTGSAAVGSGQPAANSDEDADVRALVKQLGSPAFVDRDAAERKLKELGPKAKTAVLAGTRDADPEIARRAAAVLDHIRTAERSAFARQFRDANDGPLAIDHPVWDRFRRITGDTKEAQALFAAVIADDARFRRLADAETNPADAARLYAAQFPTAVIVPAGPKGGFFPGKAVWTSPDIDPADLAAGFLLGTFPGTSAKLPDRREEDLDRRKGFAEALAGTHTAPLRRLYPAWLAARADADVLGSGLETARACNLKECLPLARKLAADPKAGVRTRADALLVVGQFGGPEDVPLARPLLTETSRYGTFLIGDPSRAQVKDIAAAVMLMVHDQKPWDFGFRCTFPSSRANDWNGRDVHVWGFPSEETRASGHKAVLAYVEAAAKRAAATLEPVAPVAPKPADLKQFLAEFRADEAGVKDFDHPLWQRFTSAAGKDKAARALFAAMVADPARADRLARAATVPASAGKLYAAEKNEVLKVHNAFYAAQRERTKEAQDEAQKSKLLTQTFREAEKSPPVGEVGALLLLGTFPGTADVPLDVPGPDRLPLDSVPLALAVHGKDAFPWSPAARRLFVAWLANRHASDDQALGLQKAVSGFGLKEALPLARRWAADPLQPPKVRGMTLPIIARFGNAADRPLADALHDHAISIGGFTLVRRDAAGKKKESPPYSATVGDVALAVSVHLAGGNPFAFGCGPPGEKSLNLACGSLGYFGFADEESRKAAHQKAKAWLARLNRK